MDHGRTEVRHRGMKHKNPTMEHRDLRAHQDDSYPTPVTNYAKTVGTCTRQSPDRVYQIAMKCVSNTHSYFDHLSKVIQYNQC